ncbi:MAG TPA: SDR family NAD(P)-dependent oxidoreductase [Ilumatobacteraceae bacterium]|jgi:NAD(P)-dependent dehydrogenase (short-subunit alcohol dehydrogenase family)
MNRLAGKVALITGTGVGMGRAAAMRFASEGATVVGCDLNPETSAETVRLVRDAGGTMIATAPVDLSSYEATERWINDAATECGGIDVLYNNASLPVVGPWEELTLDGWHAGIRNELDLVFYSCKLAWPHLVARGGGSIINVASIASIRGAAFFQQAAHGAAKGGVLSFTYHLAAAGGPHRIRANAIMPGLIRTPSTEFLFATPDSPGTMLAAANPLGRVGEADDVAKLAAFLASDDAWYINAAAIPVDGGQSVIE